MIAVHRHARRALSSITNSEDTEKPQREEMCLWTYAPNEDSDQTYASAQADQGHRYLPDEVLGTTGRAPSDD